MVAREDTQTAGVNGNGFMQAVLGAEVGDGMFELRKILRSPGFPLAHVRGEFRYDMLDDASEIRFVEPRTKLLMTEMPEHFDGVMVGTFPDERRELFENQLSVGVPNPPEVSNELAELLCKMGYVGSAVMQDGTSNQWSIAVQNEECEKFSSDAIGWDGQPNGRAQKREVTARWQSLR
jgi:hypothetical protein